MSTPLPQSGQYLQAIRQSCRSLRERNQIAITAESIERLLSSASFTNSFSRVSQAHGLSLPLKFSSHLDELNLLSVLSLLNFGSGYRVPLHAKTSRGAWDNIRVLVMSMYLTSNSSEDLLSAKGMQSISAATIAEMLNIDLHTEVQHPSHPGIVVGKLGGPLYDFVELIQKTLNSTGVRLTEGGYPSLGMFVAECLKEGGRSETPVEVVLERIVQALPAFQDMAMIDDQPVYCFKKALFLLHAIAIRFGSLSPVPFTIPSTSQLPVFSDNVLPSMLIHFGVIDLSSSPLSHLFSGSVTPKTLLSDSNTDTMTTIGTPSEGPVLTEREAFILRAAAIDACELIVEYSRNREFAWGKLDLPALDMWIWAVAKDRADYRKLPRFSLKNTVFF